MPGSKGIIQMAHSYQKDKTTSNPFLKNGLVRVGITIGVCLIVFVVLLFLGYRHYIQALNEKQLQAQQVQTQLAIEFDAITPFPNAKIVKNYTSHKTNRALVDTSYLTDAAPDDIFNYYDAQLRQRGWRLKSTEGVTDWGKDLGGKIVTYCNGDHAAELQYAGPQAKYGWTFTLSMSWGFVDCNTE